MEHNTKSFEQKLSHVEREVWQGLAKDKISVTKKMARKYGTTDGEASEKELNDLMSKFPEL